MTREKGGGGWGTLKSHKSFPARKIKEWRQNKKIITKKESKIENSRRHNIMYKNAKEKTKLNFKKGTTHGSVNRAAINGKKTRGKKKQKFDKERTHATYSPQNAIVCQKKRLWGKAMYVYRHKYIKTKKNNKKEHCSVPGREQGEEGEGEEGEREEAQEEEDEEEAIEGRRRRRRRRWSSRRRRKEEIRIIVYWPVPIM